MNFLKKLGSAIEENNSLLCVGLDPVLEKMPSFYQNSKEPLFDFCRDIVDQTHNFVMGYKPNSAFFEATGASGLSQLKKVCDYIVQKNPNLVIILDAKRADIGNTNNAYIRFAYSYLKADAITLHPYLGQEAVQSFLDLKDKGSIILCRTSNPGAGEFQDLVLGNEKKQFYKIVASHVSKKWNKNKNCMLVLGATYPQELSDVRDIVGEDIFFLVPGVGAQGGDLEKTLFSGLNKNKTGVIVAVSRSIIYSKNPAKEAQNIHEEINKIRYND